MKRACLCFWLPEHTDHRRRGLRTGEEKSRTGAVAIMGPVSAHIAPCVANRPSSHSAYRPCANHRTKTMGTFSSLIHGTYDDGAGRRVVRARREFNSFRSISCVHDRHVAYAAGMLYRIRPAQQGSDAVLDTRCSRRPVDCISMTDDVGHVLIQPFDQADLPACLRSFFTPCAGSLSNLDASFRNARA